MIKAAEAVARVARDGDLLILESTVRPRTCQDVLRPLFEEAGKKVLIAHCPERVLPGNTLEEIVLNDRIIGGLTPEAASRAEAIYKSFAKGQLLLTDATTAEVSKLIENTSRDVNIALANELESIGRELKVDILKAIDLANHHPRVQVLKPGPGVGGHCLPIDPWFLTEHSSNARLIPAARAINDSRTAVVAQLAMDFLGDAAGKRVGVLGLAYKKNVDDCRESPSLKICQSLMDQGARVRAFDPYVDSHDAVELVGSVQELENWADLLILVTDHDDFAGLHFETPLLDTRCMKLTGNRRAFEGV